MISKEMAKNNFLSDNEISLLITSPVFAGLKVAELSSLLENSSFRINDYKKGEMLANAGDEVHFQRIVISGSVKGEMVDFAGKVTVESVAALVGPLASTDRSSCTASLTPPVAATVAGLCICQRV